MTLRRLNRLNSRKKKELVLTNHILNGFDKGVNKKVILG